MLPAATHLKSLVAVGSCILDYSKQTMQEFMQRLQQTYGAENLKLHMTDTDSLMYSYTSPTGEDDFIQKKKENLLDIVDSAKLPKNHPLYKEGYESTAGHFKDECKDKHITEVIALGPKVHWYSKDGGSEDRRAKGCPMRVAANRLHREEDAHTLEKGDKVVVPTTRLGSQHYSNDEVFERKKKKDKNIQRPCSRYAMTTMKNDKVALRAFDNKVYMKDAVRSLPHGHYEAEHNLRIEKVMENLHFGAHKLKTRNHVFKELKATTRKK